MPMEHIVFVYGTLQRGQTDYPFWLGDAREAEFLGAARTLCAYPRYVHLLPCHQDCLPCVADQPSSVTANDPVRAHIYGEAFRVSTRMKAWLDILAEVRGYEAKDTRIIMPIPSTTSPDGVVACMYCSTGPHPEACTEESSCGLLPESEPFSSAWCLSAYGSRFSGAVPAHLSADAPALHQRLCALPPSLRPSAVEADARYAAPLVPPPMIIFIIDGIGDNTYPELKGRTPLEWVSGAPPPPVRADGAPTHGLPPCLQPVLLKGSPLPRVETEAGLNCLTQAGVSGMMDPYMAGMSCGSDTAHLSLFGYPPPQYYRGRGAYEALGAGLDLGDEDVAFKSNFATFADPEEDEGAVGSPAVEAASGRMLVSHRRCDRDFTVEGPLLCKDLHGTLVETDLHGVPFDYPHMIKIQYATEHRCGVALSGARQGPGGKLGRLSDAITGTDPLKDGRYLLRCEPTVPPDHAEYEAAVYTCRLVEAASAKLTAMLKAHPINAARRRANCEAAERGDATRKLVANLILFRGAAKKGWVPPFEVRHGLKGFIAAPTCIIKGLGMCCGLSGTSCLACYPTVDGPQGMDGATGDYFSNLEVKVDAVLHALRLQCPATHPTNATHAEISPFNIAILHVKGVDDAGHDANLAMKAEMLRRCGKAMQRLWNSLPPGSTMAVIADHSTPLAISDHCCEPVPVSVATKPMPGQTVPPYADGVQFYSEILAQGGGLGRFRGEELIPLLKRAHAFAHYSQHPLRN